MTDTVQVLDHRHPCIGGDTLDQPLAATRHDDIDIFRHGDQTAHGLTVGGFHHLHRLLRQARRFQPLTDAGGNCLVGVDRLGTATQDGGVAGLQTQAGGFTGHVGTGFVNNADDAQRHAHLAHLNTGRTVVHVTNTADRVRQCSHLAQAFDHAVDTRRCQLETVKHGVIQAFLAAILHILYIGFRQCGTTGIDGIGHSGQCLVLAGGIGTRHQPGSGAGTLPQFGHVRFYIHLIYPAR